VQVPRDASCQTQALDQGTGREQFVAVGASAQSHHTRQAQQLQKRQRGAALPGRAFGQPKTPTHALVEQSRVWRQRPESLFVRARHHGDGELAPDRA
jgi:hypothetical protein